MFDARDERAFPAAQRASITMCCLRHTSIAPTRPCGTRARGPERPARGCRSPAERAALAAGLSANYVPAVEFRSRIGAISALIVLGVVDVHACDHRTRRAATLSISAPGVWAGGSGYAARMATPGVIVIGSGPAGVSAAEAFRTHDDVRSVRILNRGSGPAVRAATAEQRLPARRRRRRRAASPAVVPWSIHRGGGGRKLRTRVTSPRALASAVGGDRSPLRRQQDAMSTSMTWRIREASSCSTGIPPPLPSVLDFVVSKRATMNRRPGSPLDPRCWSARHWWRRAWARPERTKYRHGFVLVIIHRWPAPPKPQQPRGRRAG